MNPILLFLSCAASLAPPSLEEVQVTATRRDLRVFDVSPAVSVVDDEHLRRNAPLTVVDHLRGEPGTFVQQTTPGQGVVILRGLKGSEVLHLVDGFRLNTAIFRNAPNQYIALVDPWNLERIETVRGAMSVLYGGDAMGGVVQFFTRAPSFAETQSQTRFKFGLQSESANESLAAYGEGEVGTERWLLHAGGAWQDVDTLRLGGGQRLPYTGYGFRAMHARLKFHPHSEDEIQLQAQFSEQPDTPRYDALVPGFGQAQPDSAEHVFKPQQRQFAQVRWATQRRRAFADSLKIQIGFQRIVDDRVLRDFGSNNRELEENESALWGLSAEASKQVSLRNELSYGLESYHDTVSSARTRRVLATGEVSTRPSRFPDGSTTSWIAAYAQDRFDLLPVLNLTAGLRFSTYDIKLADTEIAPGVRLRPDALSWTVGTLYRASERWHWVANFGHAFRPPNVFDLGTFGPRQNRFSIPNVNLGSETLNTFDLGFKYSSHTVRSELSIFHSRYKDKITQVLTGEIDPTGRLIVQSQNATALALSGIEVSLFYRPADPTEIYATATWTTGEEELDGQTYPADRIPPLFGKVEVRASLLAPVAMQVTARVDWAASQDRLSPRDRVDPRIDPTGTEGWYTVGLYAQLRLSDAIQVTLGLENLFDHRYREHGAGFDSSGRNFLLRADWTL